MADRVRRSARSIVAPLYLFVCLILGGSAQGIWANMTLQLAGVAIIAWAAIARDNVSLPRAGRHLLLLAIIGIGFIAVQLIPLPRAIWSDLGPRMRFQEGFRALGVVAPAEPLSLTPASSLNSLFAIIPPLALVCAMLRLRTCRADWLAMALIGGTLAGIGLGGLQVSSFNGQPQSPWYLYEESNWGKAVGFFANADHMGTLLVIAIPFVAAVVASARSARIQRHSATIAIAAGIGLVVLMGIALNGSLAAYGLALPVLAASTLVILPGGSIFRVGTIAVAIVLAIAALMALETTSIGARDLAEHAASATQSRAVLASTTFRAFGDFMPFGSGFGSFPSVYALYEDPHTVSQIYAVHAHNDYLEVALELGLAGIILILLFLGWWTTAAWRAWRAPGQSPFARAAAISSAAVLLHSAVDFPLRTGAIAACFGMCLALLADNRSPRPPEKVELRPARHRTVGPT